MNISTHLREMHGDPAPRLDTVVSALRSLPEREPSPALPHRIHKAIARAHNRSQWVRLLKRTASIAALLILAAHICWQNLREPPAGSGEQEHMNWIANAQETDGSWTPAKYGGLNEYAPALTALAALALSKAPDHRFDAHVQKACAALIQYQKSDGSYGGQDRAQLYNHALATLALATLPVQDGRRAQVLQRSWHFISEHQTPSGGWDYAPGSAGNISITAWYVRALDSLKKNGFADTSTAQRKALRWMRASIRESGMVAYRANSNRHSESLDALTAFTLLTFATDYPQLVEIGTNIAHSLSPTAHHPDCYRDYAKTMAFTASGARKKAKRVHSEMYVRARKPGGDQWLQAGGQLYVAALSALSRHG